MPEQDFMSVLCTDALLHEVSRFKMSDDASLLQRLNSEINPKQLELAGKFNYSAPARLLSTRLVRLAGVTRDEDIARLRILLVAHLATTFPARAQDFRLPLEIFALYPRALETITKQFQGGASQPYPTDTDDAFVKDIRMLLGLSVPCGAQAVELSSGLRLRSLVKHALTTGDLKAPVFLIGRTLGARWFGIHTDPRDLRDFHELGWEQCYKRIGKLLDLHRNVSGMVGSSWFYDPQLTKISPRLSYLQETPLRNGAIAFRNGPGKIHTERATAKSGTRKRLYEKGEYIPVCFTIAWPREAMLRWCSKHIDGSGHGKND